MCILNTYLKGGGGVPMKPLGGAYDPNDYIKKVNKKKKEQEEIKKLRLAFSTASPAVKPPLFPIPSPQPLSLSLSLSRLFMWRGARIRTCKLYFKEIKYKHNECKI